MISQVDEIKSKLDIADVIQEYFPLKQAGANMKAVCPFHDEKTPSFMVSRERQMWHCFGSCNEGGDMFTFIQKIENIEFPEALKILARKAGVELKYQDPKVTNLKTRLLEMQEVAQDFFVNQLFNGQAGKKALSYLKDTRKLEDEIIREWKLGYALDSWDALSKYLKSKGFTDSEILQGGLVVPKDRNNEYYDRFRDRLMFPIEDYHGNTVGFTGRAMKDGEAAKYVNSPGTLIYSKSEVIYGLSKAKKIIREKDAVVLVEGNMDVIASSQAEVRNVVAASGTALTADQIKILKRYTDNLIFCFDADNAGVAAAKRGIETAWLGEANVKAIALDKDKGKDPDDIIRKDKALWEKMVEQAVPAMEYFFELEFKGYNPNDIGKKKQVARNLLNLMLKLKDPIEQDFYLKQLAEKLNVEEPLLRETLQKASLGKGAQRKENILQEEKRENKVNRRDELILRLMAMMSIDTDMADYIGTNLVPKSLPSHLRDIYKSIIIYYTKCDNQDHSIQALASFMAENRPDLVQDFNAISIIAEGEFSAMDYKLLRQEVKRIVKYLRKEDIRKQLVKMSQDLRQAEKELAAQSFGSPEEKGEKEARVNELMGSFNDLTLELKEVDDS